MTAFVVNMAWRETRASWRHFLYFFVCIALGVGALVGIGMFAANVEGTVTREARALMGGDLEVRLSRPLSQAGIARLAALAGRGIETTHVSELVAMASREDRAPGRGDDHAPRPTQIVELKAVEASYPFYGTVNTSSEHSLRELLAPRTEICQSILLIPTVSHEREERTACYGAIVQEALLIKMGLAVGDHLKIGQAVFTITAVIRQEPDRVATAFSLGPRVLITQEGLAAADLVQPGSRIRERYLLRLPPDLAPEPLLYELRGQVAADSARVSTYREAQPQLRRFLNQLTRYLGLIGLTALFVGGIGVASTIHAFLKEKLRTIAILKTLGADSATVVRTYLFQALCLGCFGSAMGIALGLSIQGIMPRLLAGFVPDGLLDPTIGQTAFPIVPIFKGLTLGIATTLLFAVWPLLGIREIRPAVVFRENLTPTVGSDATPQWRLLWKRLAADPLRWSTALLIAIGMAGLAIWQAGSPTIGLLFISALAAAVLILHMAARLLITALRRAPSPRSLPIRHAMRNLHRPGSQAVGIMVSVGIGVMIIVTISLLERSLVRQVGESRPTNAPTFFFIDIQPDQKNAFQQLIQDRAGGIRPEMTPLVRSRLHAVNGQVIALNEDEPERAEDREKGDRGKSWYFTREYALTFLNRIPKDNTITKGEWWFHGEPLPHPLVSVEEEAAKNLRLNLGDTLEFDIQGATLSAEVSSIRTVEWNNFSTNFYMILSPGSLDGAPFTYVATVRVAPQEEVPLQQAVVAKFPNVTAINIGEVMNAFARILEHLSFAIRAVAFFCILAGAIVMAAALATSRYRRLYESVIFKALGATRNMIAGSFAVEYALLGTVAGVIGILLASALSWAILYFFFDLTWTFQPGVLAVAFALTIALTVMVGFLSTFRILGERPLAILRHE